MSATFTVGAPPVQRTPAIASLFKRGLAVLLDGCIVLCISIVPLGILWIAGGEPFSEATYLSTPTEGATTGELVRALLQSVISVTCWVLYRGLTTSRSGSRNGQTVGKSVCDLRITNPDGSPITAATAWKRTGYESLLLGTTSVLGAAVDLVVGSPPTGVVFATIAGGVLFFAAMVPVLRGQQRQTLYDRLAGTIVITDPKVLPGAYAEPAAAVPAGAPQPPSVYAPLIAQPAAIPSPPTGTDVSGARTIAPRPVRCATWLVVVVSALFAVAGLAAMPYIDDLQKWVERADKIRAEPENKAAIARLRTLEKLGEACLKTRAPDDCDEAGELGAVGMTFADEFDVSTDPVGAHAGQIGAVVDGDDVLFYAFTSADRIWTTKAGGGWLDRACIQADGDLCDGVQDW